VGGLGNGEIATNEPCVDGGDGGYIMGPPFPMGEAAVNECVAGNGLGAVNECVAGNGLGAVNECVAGSGLGAVQATPSGGAAVKELERAIKLFVFWKFADL